MDSARGSEQSLCGVRRRNWLARKDSNLRSPDPESGALPLGHSPVPHRRPLRPRGDRVYPGVAVASTDRSPSEDDTLPVTTPAYLESMNARTIDSERTSGRVIRFRLTGESGTEADMRVRRVGVRWIAVSDSRGREVTGIGQTARIAIVASLEWLGSRPVAELLADLRLLDVSVKLNDVSVG